MKLRSMMFVGAAALTTAALATDVLTDKTLGWMRVDSKLPITAVGVPWTDVGNPSNNVKVADLVKTDTLTAGDKLYVYNGANNTWLFYELNASKEWEAGATANSSVTPVQAGTPGTATIARGQALYLERQNPTTPDYFYVYGAVGSAIQPQTLTANSKNLVASPKAEAFVISTTSIVNATEKARGQKGDQIVVPLDGGASRVYTLVNGAWGYTDSSTGSRMTDAESCTVPLGTGFWYNTAVGSTPTINW